MECNVSWGSGCAWLPDIWDLCIRRVTLGSSANSLCPEGEGSCKEPLREGTSKEGAEGIAKILSLCVHDGVCKHVNN
eukprot:scaffold29673_cov23-Tisochrysis_lutea.AAC.1